MPDILFERVREYRDLSLTFSRNPVTNDVVAVTGVDAVKRAIKNLLMTYIGETPFFPNFGTRLYRLLFEPIDPITTSLIETEIYTMINAYEPRARVVDLSVVPSIDELQYNINVILQIVNVTDPVSFGIFLKRLR